MNRLVQPLAVLVDPVLICNEAKGTDFLDDDLLKIGELLQLCLRLSDVDQTECLIAVRLLEQMLGEGALAALSDWLRQDCLELGDSLLQRLLLLDEISQIHAVLCHVVVIEGVVTLEWLVLPATCFIRQDDVNGSRIRARRLGSGDLLLERESGKSERHLCCCRGTYY